jgi:YidC/Oxa1 family membrane protein insertase
MRSTLAFFADARRALPRLPVFFQAQAGVPRSRPIAIQSQQAQSRAFSNRLKPQSQPGRRNRPPGAASRRQPRQPSLPARNETTIENEQYKIVFTNRGAQIKHWILKKYFDSPASRWIWSSPRPPPNSASRSRCLPTSRRSHPQLNQALYQVSASGAQPSATGHALAPETSALTFHYAANGSTW